MSSRAKLEWGRPGRPGFGSVRLPVASASGGNCIHTNSPDLRSGDRLTSKRIRRRTIATRPSPMRTPRQAIGLLQIANFQNFFIDKVGDAFSGRRNGKTGFVAVERGEFFVILARAIPGAAIAAAGRLFFSRSMPIAELLCGNGNGSDEGAAFKGRPAGPVLTLGEFVGEEHVGLQKFGQRTTIPALSFKHYWNRPLRGYRVVAAEFLLRPDSSSTSVLFSYKFANVRTGPAGPAFEGRTFVAPFPFRHSNSAIGIEREKSLSGPPRLQRLELLAQDDKELATLDGYETRSFRFASGKRVAYFIDKEVLEVRDLEKPNRLARVRHRTRRRAMVRRRILLLVKRSPERKSRFELVWIQLPPLADATGKRTDQIPVGPAGPHSNFARLDIPRLRQSHQTAACSP